MSPQRPPDASLWALPINTCTPQTQLNPVPVYQVTAAATCPSRQSKLTADYSQGAVDDPGTNENILGHSVTDHSPYSSSTNPPSSIPNSTAPAAVSETRDRFSKGQM